MNKEKIALNAKRSLIIGLQITISAAVFIMGSTISFKVVALLSGLIISIAWNFIDIASRGYKAEQDMESLKQSDYGSCLSQPMRKIHNGYQTRIAQVKEEAKHDVTKQTTMESKINTLCKEREGAIDSVKKAIRKEVSKEYRNTGIDNSLILGRTIGTIVGAAFSAFVLNQLSNQNQSTANRISLGISTFGVGLVATYWNSALSMRTVDPHPVDR